MIRVAIVDDEELARAYLRELLAAHDDLEIVAEASNGFEAVKAILESKPDLVFLDVQMPKLDGFEALELVPPVAVVFVTAYDQYALRAFDVHAVDYLLKPFDAARFEAALGRARQRIGGPSEPVADLAAAARPPDRPLERLVVRDGAKIDVIPCDRLDYIEAQDDYVLLHAEGKRRLKQQTIAALEAALDPRRFVRIHRSFIVNIERIAGVEPYAKDSRVALLADGARLPVSRAGYVRLRALLDAQ
jgi:two-component system LytT family response regulator